MGDVDLKRLHTNQRLFVMELQRRGADVFAYDYAMEILLVRYGGKSVWLVDRSTQHVPLTATVLSSDKQITRDILKAFRVPVPEGRVFSLSERAAARDYAINTLNLPVVLKPHQSSHGDFVFAGIFDTEKLDMVLDHYAAQTNFPDPFIVEEHIPGDEYRIFITAKGDYTVINRDPAHVTGDGENTVEVLAKMESIRRLELKTTVGTSLGPVVLDMEVTDHLHRQGMTLKSVPRAGEKIYLRHSSNLVKGGVSRDRTAQAHPSVIDIAKRALAAFPGLPLAGIDFVTEDITCPQQTVRHAVIEVNSNPGFTMHMQPAEGTAQDVAAMAADVLFPDL